MSLKSTSTEFSRDNLADSSAFLITDPQLIDFDPEIEILLFPFIFKDIFHEIMQNFHGIDIFWNWIFTKYSLY